MKFSKVPSPRASFAAVILTTALLTFSSLPLRAQTSALSYTSAGSSGTPNNVSAGWSFTTTVPILLTDLGIRDTTAGDLTGSGGADGLATDHHVILWTSAGAQVADAVVAAGTAATLVAGFRFAPLAAAVMLAPGTYVISAYYPTPSDLAAFQVSGLMTANGITFTGARGGAGDAFPMGTSAGIGAAGSGGFFGPNFLFTNVASAVPESGGTLLLLLAAFAPLLALRAGRPAAKTA
jgi:hypothetical protein